MRGSAAELSDQSRNGTRVIKEPANEPESARHICPIGLAATDDGKCVKATSNARRLCDYKEPDDCAAQCERGSMGSCAVRGVPDASCDRNECVAR
jgi:hypothetical protein